jgi:hypothetical protein
VIPIRRVQENDDFVKEEHVSLLGKKKVGYFLQKQMLMLNYVLYAILGRLIVLSMELRTRKSENSNPNPQINI